MPTGERDMRVITKRLSKLSLKTKVVGALVAQTLALGRGLLMDVH